MEYMVLFFTQSGAIKFYKTLNQMGVSAEMMPVPRKLSSSCGVAVKLQYNSDIQSLLSGEIEKIYEVKGREYGLLYEAI